LTSLPFLYKILRHLAVSPLFVWIRVNLCSLSASKMQCLQPCS
jgi:hypothetical protein